MRSTVLPLMGYFHRCFKVRKDGIRRRLLMVVMVGFFCSPAFSLLWFYIATSYPLLKNLSQEKVSIRDSFGRIRIGELSRIDLVLNDCFGFVACEVVVSNLVYAPGEGGGMLSRKLTPWEMNQLSVYPNTPDYSSVSPPHISQSD